MLSWARLQSIGILLKHACCCPPMIWWGIGRLHAGGRWRCIQYWVRRARLSLAMMEQLDMTGRTGELARAFGIDFFSVLTRGSQYRVEAMMARLAHTQNYLLPAPSKQQARAPPSRHPPTDRCQPAQKHGPVPCQYSLSMSRKAFGT